MVVVVAEVIVGRGVRGDIFGTGQQKGVQLSWRGTSRVMLDGARRDRHSHDIAYSMASFQFQRGEQGEGNGEKGGGSKMGKGRKKPGPRQ